MDDLPPVDGRRLRSARTRARILDAARRQLLEHGFVGTTVEAIAGAADVSVQTVYYVFGTKRNVLAAVLDERIEGVAEAGPVADQPWVAELAGTEDPCVAVEALARGGVEVVARAAPIYEVVRSAAADPEVAALLEQNRSARRADQRGMVAGLAERRFLRPSVDVDTAADVVYAVLNEEVFGLLTRDCGWTVEQVQAWVAGVLRHDLLGEP